MGEGGKCVAGLRGDGRYRALQFARRSGYAPARSTVTVREWPDGRLAIEYRGRPMRRTDVTGGRAGHP
jgi:hypothetical protein